VPNAPASVSPEDSSSVHFVVAPITQRTRFFVDPGFRNLESGGDFFGREDVFGLEADTDVKKMKLDRVGYFGLAAVQYEEDCTPLINHHALTRRG
jgi:hypothetical protein